MGCCGGGSRRAQAQAVRKSGATAVPAAGAEGMVLLEYVGKNVGRTTWRGDVTGTRYFFSASDRVRLVDVRDAPGLLAQVYDRAKAFARYVEPKPAAPVAPVAPVPEAEVVAVPAPEEEAAPVPSAVEAAPTPRKRSRKKTE